LHAAVDTEVPSLPRMQWFTCLDVSSAAKTPRCLLT